MKRATAVNITLNTVTSPTWHSLAGTPILSHRLINIATGVRDNATLPNTLQKKFENFKGRILRTFVTALTEETQLIGELKPSTACLDVHLGGGPQYIIYSRNGKAQISRPKTSKKLLR
jgi:hypothetical protein